MRMLASFAAALSLTAAIACSTNVASTGTGGTGGTGASGGGTSSSSSSSGGAGGSKPACADPSSPQPFEVGSGEACFERLVSGQTVTVLSGPQGGYHIWLAIGCADCGNQVILRYGVKDPATHDWYAGTTENNAVVPVDSSGWHQAAGLQARLPGVPWDPMTVLPKGTHVILSAAVIDPNLPVAPQAEIELVLGDTEYWSPPCDPGSNCGTPGGLPCCTDGTFGDAGL